MYDLPQQCTHPAIDSSIDYDQAKSRTQTIVWVQTVASAWDISTLYSQSTSMFLLMQSFYLCNFSYITKTSFLLSLVVLEGSRVKHTINATFMLCMSLLNLSIPCFLSSYYYRLYSCNPHSWSKDSQLVKLLENKIVLGTQSQVNIDD